MSSHEPQPNTPAKPDDEPHIEKVPDVHHCDLCDAPMHEWHCRIICQYCGYQRDCSDP